MFKLFTLVVLLFSFQASAQDELLAMGMKTKELVRLKLWYEGLASEQNQQADKVEGQPLDHSKQLKEELERPLSFIDV
jgi:hypothetical protein